jgi:predicted DCC family thiol-disulfide oxidoreductase YuxK
MPITSRMTLLPRGQIFYDASCGLCSDGYRRFGPMTERRGFKWVPLQDQRVRDFLGLEGDDLPDEVKLLTTGGRLLGGVDALAFVAKSIWWGKPLWLISRIPGIHGLLVLAYKWVAQRRQKISGACGFNPERPARPSTPSTKHAA